jgi:hypothetical protein
VSEDDGNPVVTVFNYGLGKVYFCTIPVEKDYSEGYGGKDDLYRLPYDIIAESMPLTVRRDNKKIGITVHKTESGKNYVVAVNYSDKAQTTDYTLNDGKFKKAIHGKVSENNITIEPYGIAVFEVQ